MTIQLEIGNVINPTYVSTFSTVLTNIPNEFEPGFCETYSGTITLSSDGASTGASGLPDSSGSTKTATCRILVPMSNNDGDTTQKIIRSYGSSNGDNTDPPPTPLFFQNAVCVSLAGTAPNGDHVAINSVDKADVILQPQEFQGTEGNQQVLVLEMHVAFRNTTLLRVAYTITIAGQNVGSISRIEPIENTVRHP